MKFVTKKNFMTYLFYLWNNKKFQLVQCNNCKLITLDPKPTSQELELLYAEDYFDHGAHGLDAYQKTYEEIRDEIPVETWKEKCGKLS